MVFKHGINAPASLEEYRKFENLGTNFAVTDLTGNLLTVLPGERPIFISYPSDSSATLEKATAQIGIARKTYPELSRRLAAVEKAWAAVPQAKVATIPVAPVSPPPPAASKPSPGATPKGMEIVTTSGTKYENVTVTLVEPDGLSISHEAGVAKVPFTSLSPELQTKYGYDQEKAAAYAVVSAKAQQDAARRRQQIQLQQEMEKIREGGLVSEVTIRQVTDDGILGDGEYLEVDKSGHEGWSLLGYIFIPGAGAGLIDGAKWKGKLWPAGTYRYGTAVGSTKTSAVSRRHQKSRLLASFQQRTPPNDQTRNTQP